MFLHSDSWIRIEWRKRVRCDGSRSCCWRLVGAEICHDGGSHDSGHQSEDCNWSCWFLCRGGSGNLYLGAGVSVSGTESVLLVAVVVGISVRVLAGEVLAVVVAVDPETDVSRTVVSPGTLPDALGASACTGEGAGLSQVPGQSVEVDFGVIGATVGPATDVSLAVVDTGAFPVAFGAVAATGEGTVLPQVPGPNVGALSPLPPSHRVATPARARAARQRARVTLERLGW